MTWKKGTTKYSHIVPVQEPEIYELVLYRRSQLFGVCGSFSYCTSIRDTDCDDARLLSASLRSPIELNWDIAYICRRGARKD